jgi:hypothetical protein
MKLTARLAALARGGAWLYGGAISAAKAPGCSLFAIR